jgi:hypothetical protein
MAMVEGAISRLRLLPREMVLRTMTTSKTAKMRQRKERKSRTSTAQTVCRLALHVLLDRVPQVDSVVPVGVVVAVDVVAAQVAAVQDHRRVAETSRKQTMIEKRVTRCVALFV